MIQQLTEHIPRRDDDQDLRLAITIGWRFRTKAAGAIQYQRTARWYGALAVQNKGVQSVVRSKWADNMVHRNAYVFHFAFLSFEILFMHLYGLMQS